MATVVLRGDRVLSTDKAIATYKFLEQQRPLNRNGGDKKSVRYKKNSQHTVFEGPNPDELREAGEAYQKYGSRIPDRSGSGVGIDGARISSIPME